jgi:hypothetical protein
MKKNQNHINQPGSENENSRAERDLLNSGPDPFLIPQNYFDDLPQRVMDKVLVNKGQLQMIPYTYFLLKRLWMPLAIAAAFSLFLIVRQPSTQLNRVTKTDTITPTIHSSEYDPTYADEALLLEESAITENDEAQINYASMTNALYSPDTSTITIDEKIQYLLDENYDIDLLTEL